MQISLCSIRIVGFHINMQLTRCLCFIAGRMRGNGWKTSHSEVQRYPTWSLELQASFTYRDFLYWFVLRFLDSWIEVQRSLVKCSTARLDRWCYRHSSYRASWSLCTSRALQDMCAKIRTRCMTLVLLSRTPGVKEDEYSEVPDDTGAE